jgi:hypothetical protein
MNIDYINISARLPVPMKEKIEDLAKKERRSFSGQLEVLLTGVLDAKKK